VNRTQAEAIADAIFADLRDRRFLKWMLAENADSMGPILHERDGTPLMPISEAVQAEMRSEWIDLLLKLKD
jgi:hypothetical protein